MPNSHPGTSHIRMMPSHGADRANGRPTRWPAPLDHPYRTRPCQSLRRRSRGRHAGKSYQFSNVSELCPSRRDRADSVLCLPVSPGQFVPAIHRPERSVCLHDFCLELHAVSVHDSVLHLLGCLLRSVRPEFWPKAEAEDKLTRALSRSEFQGRFISRCRRGSSSDENRSRQQPSMAGDSRERIVHWHWDLWRNRNTNATLLYAPTCPTLDSIQPHS